MNEGNENQVWVWVWYIISMLKINIQYFLEGGFET